MANDLSFYINNTLVNPPENWQNLDIEVEWDNDSPDASIKTTTFTWLGSNATILNEWFKSGLSGGFGIFQGIPFQIKVCNGIIIFDGVIDMTSSDTTFQCDLVRASVIETNRIDFLNDVAESFTFAYLYSIGNSNPSTTDPAPIDFSTVNGLFTGTQLSPFPGTPVTGYVVNGFINCNVVPFGIGAFSIQIQGNIAAYPGVTFTFIVHGVSPVTSASGLLVSATVVSVTPVTGTSSVIGSITRHDFIAIPYVLSSIPNWWQAANFIITFIGMIKLVLDAIRNIISNIQNAAASFPIYWEMAMFSAVATAYTFLALYLTLLAVNVLKMLINEIIQPIKFKYGMKVITLFQRACQHLGLNFSSSILEGDYRNLVIMPEKQAYFQNEKETDNYIRTLIANIVDRKLYDDVLNPNSYGYYDGTFADLIRDMCDVFNAKVLIRDNTLYFERWDYWNNDSLITLPNISTEAPFDNTYGTNASELSSNYLVEYLLDTMDHNTYDHYEGTSCQMILQPAIAGIIKNSLLKGLTEKKLNFALAKRKIDYTAPEKVVNFMIDRMLSDETEAEFIVAITISATMIPIYLLWRTLRNLQLDNDRIGCLLLSTDFTGIQKLLVVEDETIWHTYYGIVRCHKVDEYNNIPNGFSYGNGFTDAYRLSKDFHSASWAVDTLPFINYTMGGIVQQPKTFPNQYLTYKSNEIPMCCSDFAKLKNTNIIKTFDGRLGRVTSCRWNPHTETAEIDYKINEIFTKNLKQQIIIDGNHSV